MGISRRSFGCCGTPDSEHSHASAVHDLPSWRRYDRLPECRKLYKLIDVIGEGSFSTVRSPAEALREVSERP